MLALTDVLPDTIVGVTELPVAQPPPSAAASQAALANLAASVQEVYSKPSRQPKSVLMVSWRPSVASSVACHTESENIVYCSC